MYIYCTFNPLKTSLLSYFLTFVICPSLVPAISLQLDSAQIAPSVAIWKFSSKNDIN